MMLQILFLVAGLVFLVKGADWLVKGAAALARKFRIPDLAIGLTIVAFGTSAPELVVNIYSAWNDYPDLVFGNVIGSNNFNLFIILGLTGMILPLSVQSSTVWKEIPISFMAILLIMLMGSDFLFQGEAGILSRIDGVILLAGFSGFLYYVYRQLGTDKSIPDSEHKPLTGFRMTLLILGGLAGLVIGGRVVVENAIDLATAWGMSEKVIGLTIVAAGTSLPELATSLVAAWRKNNDIAVGNVIGSNIFNIFLILGVSSLIRPLSYNLTFNTDLMILGVGTLFLFLAMFAGKRRKLDRWEAAILFISYSAYTGYLLTP